MKPFTMLAIAVFTLMAVGHLCRLIWGLDVVVGGTFLPQWISVAGLVIAGGLALMLWRESRL